MSDQQQNSKYLFRVTNGHGESYGQPPSIDGDKPNHRYSYFQNDYGEQLIFEYDMQAQQGCLWMGDAGWEQSYPVENGFVPELVLTQVELLWLAACWGAATGKLPTKPD